MFNRQSNKARTIYTLSNVERFLKDDNTPVINDEYSTPRILLNNGYYFTKESRSDEKLLYTEGDIESIVRTILFIHAFRVVPRESTPEMVYSGNVTLTWPNRERYFENVRDDNSDHSNDTEFCDIKYEDAPLILYNQLDEISECVRVLDNLLGEGFCLVARRPLQMVHSQYMTAWRYHMLKSIRMPSAADYIKLYRFINTVNVTYSIPTIFILQNTTDNKLPLQSREKRL